MSRVIHTDGPGQQRHRLRRTVAETLRRLMTKRRFDDEAKDLASLIVFSLREMADGVDRSASAWEKRGYFVKADQFRQEWEWLEPTAAQLSQLIVNEDWTHIPVVLAQLTPRFADIRVKRLTRSAAIWQGCHERLVAMELSSA